MCGIFGHIGEKGSVDQCLKGLKFLEYRGYDSAGIAGARSDGLLCMKEKGKISELEKLLDKKIRELHLTIGHTRWATHGKATKLNAHPHLDQNKDIALVHNGILENHHSIRVMLEKQGVFFESDTDSEVIAQLIAHLYQDDILAAVREASSLMKGFWGIALIHKDYPDQIIALSRENPIVVGISHETKEAFVSSDPYAFGRNDLDLYFLKNDEIAVLTKEEVKIFDPTSGELLKEPEKIELPDLEITKGPFEHFMLKEIFDQPLAIRSSIHNRFILENGDACFENFQLTSEELSDFTRILILGCGTSWHAGCIAAQQFEELAHIPSQSIIASEYRYKKTRVDKYTLVIILSQSGETFDTIAAMRKVKAEGAHVVAICNVPSSTLMREADSSILLRAGPEISVCCTKAFTCQLSVLALIALKFARLKGMSQNQGEKFLDEILNLPAVVDLVLDQKEKIAQIAAQYAQMPNFFFLGRQYMYHASLEAALKLKEISYLNASGYPAGELKHGPIALIDSQSVVLGLCGNTSTFEKTLSNLREVKARGAKIIALVPSHSLEIEEVADHILYLPQICDELSSIPYSVALQLFAYYIAKNRGANIDQPRNLAKSVTVE